MSIYTLGHSTLLQPEFALAAASGGVEVIIDTRSHPGSGRVPHFGQHDMEIWLPAYRMKYEWWPALGGWSARHAVKPLVDRMAEHGVDIMPYTHQAFPKQRIAATRKIEGDGPEWTNMGLYDYSWYMTMPGFLSAIDWLCALFSHRGNPNCAIVCAEAQWWRCHRSMIADYLHWRGVPCFHLPTHPPKRSTTPRWKAHADVIGNRLQRYDPRILKGWEEWASQGQVKEST